MKKFFKFSGICILVIAAAIAIFYMLTNENLPEGKQGKEADELATKMLEALNIDAYKNTEIITWSFRNQHHYTWHKNENFVVVKWAKNTVRLYLNAPEKNILLNENGSEITADNQAIFKQATNYFNNDSFWLVAPYKVFDAGTERRIVQHNGKDALLITYTSGGTTPGDSYLWLLDENYLPTSFKMWTRIIPIGGVAATWNDWKNTETGIKLPTKHTLSLFGLEIDMGTVKTENRKADALATKILKAIKHEAYKKTRFLEWSFAGKRSFKWDKNNNIVAVSWDSILVNLQPDNLEKSSVFFNTKKQNTAATTIVKKAWDIFNNDSFWLVAPHKLFDNGAIRSIKNIDNQEVLYIKYTSGGTTPGDSYLWFLDENYVPKSFKMFIPSKKMDGVPATWEDWITTESGTLVPTNHVFLDGRNLSMGTVKGYN